MEDIIQDLMLGTFSAMIEISHDPHLPIYAAICWLISFSLALHWVLLVTSKSEPKQAQMQISNLDNTAAAL